MRSIRVVGLLAMLLIVAYGQPADLLSSAPVSEATSAAGESASSAPKPQS